MTKLDTSVFTLKDKSLILFGTCRPTTRYAAVDADGRAYYFRFKPEIEGDTWQDRKHRNADTDRIPGIFDATDWEHSLIERPAEYMAPKLTAEVFDLPNCPSWARYAAVDSDGIGMFYADRPVAGNVGWIYPDDSYHRTTVIFTADDRDYRPFDATDWKHSLIQRSGTDRRSQAEGASCIKCALDTLLQDMSTELQGLLFSLESGCGEHAVPSLEAYKQDIDNISALIRRCIHLANKQSANDN